MNAQARGLIIAAPASGSGKTVVTLGLLRSFARAGIRVISAKVGPDYIDPAFHEKASERPCRNLDTWAMRSDTIAQGISELAAEGELIICEGVMGLFDGAHGVSSHCNGSTASLARVTGWPILLIVDVAAQAASVAALVRGFASHDPEVPIAGVLFNRVGSASHEAILRESMEATLPNIPILACLERAEDMELPSRHLGLVQAQEHEDLDVFLEKAADVIDSNMDFSALAAMTGAVELGSCFQISASVPALGQRIAVARDAAFSFTYSHVLDGWYNTGISLEFFSPLEDQGPSTEADAIYLPGGYPELHAELLSNNLIFRSAMFAARDRGSAIFGECGGYMVLGEYLETGDGTIHPMLGFLPVKTSLIKRSLKIGYRKVQTVTDSLLGTKGTIFFGHEFHYATAVVENKTKPLFQVANAVGIDMGKMGLVEKRVAGSFIHLIDCQK